ncbi:MAG: DUF222 domain-containing protein [Acidimicrobiales bacterium]
MGASQVRRAAESFGQATSELCVGDVPVPVAADLAEVLSRVERQAGALRLALCRRVTEAGAHRLLGERDAASYAARLSGTSIAKAKGDLALGERLAALPEVTEAVRQGRVSTDQAKVIAAAAEADPGTTGELLRSAEEDSFSDLRRRSGDIVRATRSEEDQVERERRVHARRYCRTWAPEEGGLRLDAWVSSVEGAKLLSALAKKTDELFERAPDEPVERLRADALVELVTRGGVRAEVTVRADAAALVRGEVLPGEACEIDGVGPVSVTRVRSLLGEAWMTLLLTDGADIRTVTSTTRVVPRRVRIALEARDRTCVVPGCGARLHLEIHHWRTDFAEGGLTELDNMCRMCKPHHKLVSETGWRILGGPGRWRFIGPRAVPRARAGPPARSAGGAPTGPPPSGAPPRAPSGGRPPPRRPARSSR